MWKLPRPLKGEGDQLGQSKISEGRVGRDERRGALEVNTIAWYSIPLKVIQWGQLIYPPGPQYTIRNYPP